MEGLKNLHQIFMKTAKDFDKVQQQIENFESVTTREINALIKRADETAPVPNVHPLKKFLEQLQKDLHRQVNDWTKLVKSYEKNTKFRRDYGDSLLIYTFGAVKSGKSSLGNLLIHGKHDPKPSEVHPDVEAKLHVDSGQSNLSEDEFKKTKKFKVDFMEATSAIQLLKIPGLTLVDSPGVHSSTEKNGKLAKEYLECADLVLFIGKSPSWCTQSEIEEIKEIKGEFLFVVAHCDELDSDEDEHGNVVHTLVMKSGEARQKIFDWCFKHISEKGVTNFNEKQILTISTLYAEEHPDSDGWRESGLEALVRKLATIADEGQSLNIKRTKPLINLQNYNRKILESIPALKKELGNVEKGSAEFREKIKEKGNDLTRIMNRRLRSMIKEIVGENAKDKAAIKAALDKRVPEIFNDLSNALLKETQAAGGYFLENLQRESVSLASLDFPSVEDIRRTITYHVERDKKGGLLGTLLGSGLGFLVGGPLGAAVLAPLLGATLGAEIGSRIGGGERKETEVVGDNRDEVIEHLTKKVSELGRQHLICATDHLTGEQAPLECWLKDLRECFERTERTLQDQNNAIDSEINKTPNVKKVR